MFDFLFKKLFGLHITDSAVRVADQRITLEIPLPPGVVIHGKIRQKTALIQTLKDLKNQKSISSYRCALALDSSLYFERVFPFPSGIKEVDLKEFLDEKVPKVIPLAPWELRYDYAVIRESDPPFLWIAATRLEWLNDYRECIEKAGLRPLVIEPAGLSMLRILAPLTDAARMEEYFRSGLPDKISEKDPFQIARGAALSQEKSLKQLPKVNFLKK